MRTVRYEFLRPQEILDEKKRKSIVYLPIAPLEWHGPALPYGTDPLAAEAFTRGAAKVTGGVVMPTLYFGSDCVRPPEILEAIGFEDTSQYIIGMDAPQNSMKSFYTKEDVFSLIVREYLRLLVEQEYKLIVLVNGHGGRNQIAHLERLAIEFSNETNSNVLMAFPLAHYEEDDGDYGHATKYETSIQMYLNSENVDLSQLPPKNVKLKNTDWGIVDGCTFHLNPNKDKTVVYDPRDATAERGRKYVEASISMLVKQVSDRWDTLSQMNIIKE